MSPRAGSSALLLAAALLLPPAARAGEAPTAAEVPPAVATATTGAATGTAAAPPASEGPGLEVRAGLGYYEAAHVGVTWRISERHAVGAFAGTNFGLPTTAVGTLGLDWSYLVRTLAGFESAFLVRGLYWTAVDELYRWKLLSAQVGGAFSRHIAPRTSLALDATAVRTFVVESDRKQDQAFGNPQKWNLSVCLSVTYRVASW